MKLPVHQKLVMVDQELFDQIEEAQRGRDPRTAETGVGVREEARPEEAQAAQAEEAIGPELQYRRTEIHPALEIRDEPREGERGKDYFVVDNDTGVVSQPYRSRRAANAQMIELSRQKFAEEDIAGSQAGQISPTTEDVGHNAIIEQMTRAAAATVTETGRADAAGRKTEKKLTFFGFYLTSTKYEFILYAKELRYMIVSMIIEKIRKQIESCSKRGKTRYRISKDTGVGEDQLCRIMQGKTCTLETAERLLKYFGLTVTKKKKG